MANSKTSPRLYLTQKKLRLDWLLENNNFREKNSMKKYPQNKSFAYNMQLALRKRCITAEEWYTKLGKWREEHTEEEFFKLLLRSKLHEDKRQWPDAKKFIIDQVVPVATKNKEKQESPTTDVSTVEYYHYLPFAKALTSLNLVKTPLSMLLSPEVMKETRIQTALLMTKVYICVQITVNTP